MKILRILRLRCLRPLVCAGLAAFLVGTAVAHPAVEVVDLIWDHIGGKENFEKCRYIEFTWQSETDGQIKRTRKHTWDRYEGDYVVEFTDASGDAYTVYMNVETLEGVALKNGSKLSAEENAAWVETAYEIFCNDTYWLLSPTKLQDPGARIQFVGHAGEKDADGSEGEFIVLHLWFEDNVGVTPGDEYWFNITHEGVIASWRYVLEDGEKNQWEWTDERDCGMGMLLSTRKVSGNRAITFPEVKFSETIDRSVFTPPGG